MDPQKNALLQYVRGQISLLFKDRIVGRNGRAHLRPHTTYDQSNRPNLFINELRLYVDYMKIEIQKRLDNWNAKEQKYFGTFKANLQDGINHYKGLIPKLLEESEHYRELCGTNCSRWNRSSQR